MGCTPSCHSGHINCITTMYHGSQLSLKLWSSHDNMLLWKEILCASIVLAIKSIKSTSCAAVGTMHPRLQISRTPNRGSGLMSRKLREWPQRLVVRTFDCVFILMELTGNSGEDIANLMQLFNSLCRTMHGWTVFYCLLLIRRLLNPAYLKCARCFWQSIWSRQVAKLASKGAQISLLAPSVTCCVALLISGNSHPHGRTWM